MKRDARYGDIFLEIKTGKLVEFGWMTLYSFSVWSEFLEEKYTLRQSTCAHKFFQKNYFYIGKL